MKSKIKVIVVLSILSFLVGSHALFCNTQDSAENKKNKKETVKILKEMHPFYDAKGLDDAFKERVTNVILAILSKYAKEIEIKDLKKAKDTFKENPFLNAWLAKYQRELSKHKFKSKMKTPKEVSTSQASGTGFLSPTMVVNALGSLIAKRFKEELTIRYLEKFRDKLNTTDLKILFPSTIKFLLSSHIFNFKTFMSTLKEAFQNDLNHMDSNLYVFLEEKRKEIVELEKKIKAAEGGDSKEKNKKEKNELEKMKNELMKMDSMNMKKGLSQVLFLWDIVVDVKAEKHPVDIINNLSNSDYINDFDTSLSSTVRLLSMISRNLVNKEGDGWIKAEELKTLIEKGNENQRELFIGLVYAREIDELDEITFDGNKLKDIIAVKAKEVKTINLYVEKTIEYMDRLKNFGEEIKDKINEFKKLRNAGKKIGFEQYYSYIKMVFEVIELGCDIKEFTGDANVFEKIKKYLGYGTKILEVSWNIHDKEYGVAVMNALILLDAGFSEDSKFKKEISKYLSFLNTMAIAKDAKEMQVAMEAFFLPVGSYRINRGRAFSFTLNAYPGVFFSGERLTTKEEIAGDELEGNFGIAAPIGLAITLGRGGFDKPGPSVSLFVSVIDIGAVFNYRLGSDGGLPEFTWKNVWAPGAFFMIGLKDSPISIGGGIQYGPQLREIKPPSTDGGDPEAVIKSRAFRFGLILAVDIPLLRF